MKFRVSTITAVGDVNTALNLVHIFNGIHLDCGEGEGFTSVKIGERTRTWMETDSPLLSKPEMCSSNSSKLRDHFGNQVTLVLSMDGTRINMKAFTNGKVQLTGVKRIDQGLRAIEHLVSVLKTKKNDFCADPDKLRAGGYRICMINSDLDLGFAVKRDRLFSFVRESYPNMLCTYEPCNYHGVKFKYMWNSARSDHVDNHGVCRCGSGLCAGNSDGSEEGKCRRVTVAVFQSGKVIATGAQTMTQLEDALRFLIKDVCRQDHRDAFALKACTTKLANSMCVGVKDTPV